MSDPLLLGIISTIGVVLSAVFVELVRTRRSRRSADDAMSEVRAELKPNGGSSMKDQMNRFERKFETFDERQRDHAQQLTTVTVRLDEHLKDHP